MTLPLRPTSPQTRRRGRGHCLRQAVLAVAAGIVLRPLHGKHTATPSFVTGWIAGELAPQVLALSLFDTAIAVRRGRASRAGIGLSAATTAGLGLALHRALRARAALSTATKAEVSALAWRGLVRPLCFTDRAVTVEKDLRYGPHGGRNLLDLYRPADQPLHAAPVLVQIHGGAWTIGRKEEQGRLLMNRMAARGWVCVAINYRLAPRDRWPAHLEDVEAALAWVGREVEAYGGDPRQVYLTGGSAGGHLATLAALRAEPGTVAGCVPFYGVYDLLGEDGDRFTLGMRQTLLAPRIFTPGADDEVYRDASPLHQVHPDAPDFFVLHGSHDSLVSVRQARAFVARLRSVSQREVAYAEVPFAQHAFDLVGSIRAQYAVAAVEAWLTRHQRTARTALTAPTAPTELNAAGPTPAQPPRSSAPE